MKRKSTPVLVRWQKRTSIPSLYSCWTWRGAVTGGNRSWDRGGGYGRIWNGERPEYVHRMIWIECYGPIPDGWSIDHLCRNRLCSNPLHLEAVPVAENTRRSNSDDWRTTEEIVW